MLIYKININNIKSDITTYSIVSVTMDINNIYFITTVPHKLVTGDIININNFVLTVTVQSTTQFYVNNFQLLNIIPIDLTYTQVINNVEQIIYRTSYTPALETGNKVAYAYSVYEDAARLCSYCGQTVIHKIVNNNGYNQHICTYCGYIDYIDGDIPIPLRNYPNSSINVITDHNICDNTYVDFYLTNPIANIDTIYNIDFKDANIWKDNTGFNIPIQINNVFNTNVSQTEDIQNDFITDQENDSINSIVDMEKIRYSPYYYNSLSNQIPSYSKIQQVIINFHFYNSYITNWDINTTLLGNLGFIDTDIKYQKTSLKNSFIRLLYYDSPIPSNQLLLSYNTIFVNTSNLFSQYINGYRISLNNAPSSISPSNTFYTTFIINDPRLKIDNNSSEGFYLYSYKNDDTNLKPNPIYLRIEFNNALTGQRSLFFNRKPSSQKGISTNNLFLNNITNGTLLRQYAYLRLDTVFNKDTNEYIYYFDTINNTIENQNVIFNNGILTIDIFEAKVI
jgi:hypothetical protein